MEKKIMDTEEVKRLICLGIDNVSDGCTLSHDELKIVMLRLAANFIVQAHNGEENAYLDATRIAALDMALNDTATHQVLEWQDEDRQSEASKN
jgi:hypothetical protein